MQGKMWTFPLTPEEQALGSALALQSLFFFFIAFFVVRICFFVHFPPPSPRIFRDRQRGNPGFLGGFLPTLNQESKDWRVRVWGDSTERKRGKQRQQNAQKMQKMQLTDFIVTGCTWQPRPFQRSVLGIMWCGVGQLSERLGAGQDFHIVAAQHCFQIRTCRDFGQKLYAWHSPERNCGDKFLWVGRKSGRKIGQHFVGENFWALLCFTCCVEWPTKFLPKCLPIYHSISCGWNVKISSLRVSGAWGAQRSLLAC